MNLVQFKKDIEKELELRILNNDETPILDRLQIHLDQLKKDYNLSTMLNPKNIQHELYLSMLYQIVYPTKLSKEKMILKFKGDEICGSSDRDKIKNLIIKVGVSGILKLKEYKGHLHKLESLHKLKNGKIESQYKMVGDGYYFDVSFGGKGHVSKIKGFVKEINDILKLNIKINR